MQAVYQTRFTREMGCTEGELLQVLPGACRGAPITLGQGGAEIALNRSSLRMSWQALPPRRIALITLPCLKIHFDFGDTGEQERHAFMKHFDLYTQRGGG